MQQPSNVGLSTAKLGFGFTAITFAAIAATAAGSCCTDVYAPKSRIERMASATASCASASVRALPSQTALVDGA